MKQIIELRDTEKRKMIAETFGISLANLNTCQTIIDN